MSRPPRLFGTDGIRHRAGTGDLSPERVLAVGRALGALTCSRGSGSVLVARDTRVSGPAIVNLLVGGILSQGVDCYDAGILPTPALAQMTRAGGHALGVVVSASHNPPEDNGIKVLGPDGYKLGTDDEEALERGVAGAPPAPAAPTRMGTSRQVDLREAYLSHLGAALGADASAPLQGMTVVLDCARGATALVAAEAFRRQGARVHIIHDELDGARINEGCGAMHPEAMAAATRETGADLGCAFDGDGDRTILADAEGTIRNGDHILAITARDLLAHDQLPGRLVVTTVMANLGLEKALAGMGARMVRTPVGDRYVVERLRADGGILGGEQSGHIVFLDRAVSGDGILTALLVATIVHRSGRPLSDLAACVQPYPQITIDVAVCEKPPLESLSPVAATLGETERALGTNGRVVLRYSGTEPKARVMIEGTDGGEVQRLAHRLAEVIRAEIGT